MLAGSQGGSRSRGGGGGGTQSHGDRPNPVSANPGSSGVGLSLCSSRTPALFWDDTSLPPLCPFLSSWHVASQRRERILSGPAAQREKGSLEGKLPSFSVIHFLYEQLFLGVTSRSYKVSTRGLVDPTWQGEGGPVFNTLVSL